jgi:ATP-dependent HslUV protease ATP-binding subunit HslU
MKTEKVDLVFALDSLNEIASYAAILNQQMENIGARRLHTILEKVVEEISFSAPEKSGEIFTVDAAYVKKALDGIVKDQDLSRYIL